MTSSPYRINIQFERRVLLRKFLDFWSISLRTKTDQKFTLWRNIKRSFADHMLRAAIWIAQFGHIWCAGARKHLDSIRIISPDWLECLVPIFFLFLLPRHFYY